MTRADVPAAGSLPLSAVLAAFLVAAGPAGAQCPEEPRLDNHTGAGTVACPCFVAGEEAGAIFSPPAEHFPIEILRVGIGWGSQFGGNPPQVEEAIHIYPAGLPDPGTPVFTLPGPQMQDGFINEFNLEPQPGEIIINAPPFTVTLEFANTNANNIFAPSVVHDGAGCTPGRNVVFAIPGGWTDGCALNITGDWVFYVVYRRVECATGAGRVPDGDAVAGAPLTAALDGVGDLTLDWSASCNAGDDDYEVYEGTIGLFYDHASRFCSTGGATTITFTPGVDDHYYIVVPRNDASEGSYGFGEGGAERPVAAAACLPQSIEPCP